MMVQRLLIFLLVATVWCTGLRAQTLRGAVADADSVPIPYAAIYIDELRQGVSADDQGRFQLVLPAGTYHCTVTSLGYKSLESAVTVASDGSRCYFVLEQRPYELQEVQVTADGSENPANVVMRQVIARAPYYECCPDTFAARAYVKGKGKLTDMPGILNLSADYRKEKDKYVDRLFVLEKVSQVTFSAPSHWTEHVEAERNSFPEDLDFDLPVSIENFYGSTLFGSPSPVREGAFTYYRFTLEDTYDDGGRTINKIAVEPRRDSKGLFSGHIYVVEGEWCLSAVDLTMKGVFVNMHVTATMQEVRQGVFLPVSQAVEATASVLGAKLEAAYTLSAQYSFIGNRPDEGAPTTERGEKLALEIERLSVKGQMLSNQEAYELASLNSRLIENNMLAQQRIQRRSKYDLTYKLGTHRATTDSTAASRDSAYWAAMRSVPLDDEELESYRRQSNDTTKGVEKVMNGMLGNSKFTSADRRRWIRFDGIKSFFQGFNFVDGYKVGLKFTAGYDFSDNLKVRLQPSVFYNTARKMVTWNIVGRINYAPMRDGRFRVWGGRVTADYNQESPEDASVVTIATAIFGRNDVKYYDRTYATVFNDIEIANGTRLYLGATWERRNALDNHVARSWFKREASPNVPANSHYAPLPVDNQAFTAKASITCTPAAYYYIRNGRKRYLPSKFPTITLSYTRGIAFDDQMPEFNRLDLSVEQRLEVGVFHKLTYQVRGGIFIGAKRLQFTDFKHFSATRFPLTTRDFASSFVLLDNYGYSTSSRWAEAGFTWQALRLLLKQLPFLRDKNFNECLHLRSVVTHHRQPYSELGYSVNIFNVVSAGIFTSWNGKDYNSVCASVSIPLDRIL